MRGDHPTQRLRNRSAYQGGYASFPHHRGAFPFFVRQ